MRSSIIILSILSWTCFGFVIGLNSAPKPYIQPDINFNHPTSTRVAIIGTASWYDYDLKRKDQKCLDDTCWSLTHNTCASRRFKRHSMVTIKNLDNGNVIECFVNDYGPKESTGREIDLSSHAFSQLAPLSIGLLNVEVYESK
jgi:rare lipoprotein A (peptidoglycan hydrolase)